MVAAWKARSRLTAALPAACTQRLRSATAPSRFQSLRALAGTACPRRGDSFPAMGEAFIRALKARPDSRASLKGHRDTAPVTRAVLASRRDALFARRRASPVLDRERGRLVERWRACERAPSRTLKPCAVQQEPTCVAAGAIILSRPFSSARLSPPLRWTTSHSLPQAANASSHRPPAGRQRLTTSPPCPLATFRARAEPTTAIAPRAT